MNEIPQSPQSSNEEQTPVELNSGNSETDENRLRETVRRDIRTIGWIRTIYASYIVLLVPIGAIFGLPAIFLTGGLALLLTPIYILVAAIWVVQIFSLISGVKHLKNSPTLKPSIWICYVQFASFFDCIGLVCGFITYRLIKSPEVQKFYEEKRAAQGLVNP